MGPESPFADTAAAKGRQEVTVTDNGSEMIPRREFLKKVPISDSTEQARAHRKPGLAAAFLHRHKGLLPPGSCG
jgi:hypothetical protein